MSRLSAPGSLRGLPLRVYFIVLVSVFVLSAGAAGLYVHMQARKDSRAAARTDATFAANAAARQLGGFLRAQQDAVAGLAANPAVAKALARPAGCSLSYAGLGGADASHLDVIRADGTVTCSSRPPGAGGTSVYKNSAWLRRALRAPVTLAPVLDPRTGRYVALNTRPIGGHRGVIAGFADLSSVGSTLAAQYGGGHPDEFLVITADGGRVVSRSIDPRHWIGRSLASTPAEPRQSSFERSDLDGTPRLYAQARVPGLGWRLLVGEQSAAAFAAGDRLQKRELSIIGIGLAIVLLGSWLVYRNLAVSMRRLSRNVHQARTSGDPIVRVSGPNEVARLGGEFAELIAALEVSSEQYRRLFEANPNPMWVFDTATLRFLAVNEAAIQSYGYTREEFLAMTIEDLRTPEDALRLRAYLAEQGPPDERRLNRAGLWRHRRRDGTTLDVEVTSHDHQFDGRSARVVLALDVTERARAEDALRASEARYRDLFENATDLIATTDLEGQLTDVNKSFLERLGYAREALIGRPILDFVPPEQHDRLTDARLGKLGGKPATVYTHDLVAGDGAPVRVEVATRLLEVDGYAIGVEAICRDLSDRTRAEALETQLRQAQRLESVGRLAGGIAHDFNNLLTVINGYTEALLETDDRQDAFELGEIAAAARRATTLTQQLLAFSRRQVLQPRVIDLNDTVSALTPMLKRLIGEHIELIAPLDPDLHHVLADPGQIEQILVNLVVNARDAMPDGGRLTIETGNAELDDAYVAEHPDATTGPHAVLAVTDTGTGMSQETAAQIFEPFFTTKPVGAGTGLGLSTVYGIVRQSGGTIWVYSEPGRGSSFKVYFPATQAPSTIEPQPAQPARVPDGIETILLAEDEPALRALTSHILTKRGYTVLSAETPHEALALAERNSPPIDLLLTDLVMPHMDGRELANQIIESVPGIRVLFTSGYADQSILSDETIELAPFIEKPFTATELAVKVREVLDAEKVSERTASRAPSLVTRAR